MSDPTQLRAGNSDREAVIGLLQQAYAEGRLTDDELAQRCATTHEARTFGDLDAVVADLPVASPSQVLTGAAPARPSGSELSTPNAPGSTRLDPLIIDAGWWFETRKGAWEIPPFVLVKGSAGQATINCLEATTTQPQINMEIQGGAGTITVVVPEGWGVDSTRLDKSFGWVRDKVAEMPTMGRPQIVVTGSAAAGTITFRHPNMFERRAAEKNLR